MKYYPLRLIFTFWCISWMITLFGQITNPFGVCYNPTEKTFEISLELKRGIIVHDNGNVSTLRKREHITASNLTRLNENYYLANFSSGLHDYTKSQIILFRYYLNDLDKENSRCYGYIELPTSGQKQMPIAVGEFLLIENLAPNLQGAVIHNGRCFKSFLGGSPSMFYLSDTDGYLFWQNSPFNLLTRTHYSYYDAKLNKIKQTPFCLAFSVWNQVVYGISIDSENPMNAYPCLYDLATERIHKLPDGIVHGENIISILPVESNELITWSSTCDGSMKQVIRDLDLNVKNVEYSYQREHNVLIKTFQDGRTLIVDSRGRLLVENFTKFKKMVKVDLNQDLDNQIEALLCTKEDQMVLVDCVNGTVYCADKIEHVGLGFFRLINNGKEEWLTL